MVSAMTSYSSLTSRRILFLGNIQLKAISNSRGAVFSSSAKQCLLSGNLKTFLMQTEQQTSALGSWTELLKLSSAVKPSNSNYFCKIYLHLSEWIAPFLGKNTTFLQTEKWPCVVLKCWKCFAIISYNVKHRHTVLSIFMTPTYVYEISITCKTRSPLRLYEVTGGELQ